MPVGAMRALRVTTWNVLHRVHAVNWKEPQIEAFPDERARIAGISKWVAEWLAADISVVCLQEVSGDQLLSLRGLVDDDVRIFAHVSPRVPRLRDRGALDLQDPREHLVTLAKAPSSRLWSERTFDRDPGKAVLAIDVGDGIAVLNTHVSFGERGRAQLAVLAAMAREASRAAVVLGDFNASATAVRAGLGEDVVVSNVDGERPTRTATAEHPGRTIDHVAVWRGTVEFATVLEGRGLSDHNPVSATLSFGSED